MLRTITRQTLAVVVAIAVVWSFVGAPVAAAAALETETSSGLEELNGSEETSADPTEGSDNDDADDADEAGGADDESDADENSSSSKDGSEEETETDDNSTSDDGDDDSGGDRSLRDGDSSDENGSDNSTVERGSERVKGAVNETVGETAGAVQDTMGELEDTTGDALGVDADAETVTETTDGIVSRLSLETALGLTGIDFLDPFETDAEPGGDTYTYDRTGEDDHATFPGDRGGDDWATGLDDAETAAGDGDDGQPDPANPAGGAAIGIGAVVTAAALRGSPVVAGSKAATSNGWFSTLVEKVRPFVLPLRYSRYDDSDPLEHEARERVYEIVNETPGSYLSEVSQEAGLPLSTTRHHIKVLEREDLVTGAKLHGKRRFYPAYAEGIELAAALNDDSTATIIDAIARIGAASVSDLADEIGRDPSTISHHLQRLEEDGVITRERDGRAVVNKLSAEARTALEPEAAPEAAETGEVVAGGAD